MPLRVPALVRWLPSIPHCVPLTKCEGVLVARWAKMASISQGKTILIKAVPVGDDRCTDCLGKRFGVVRYGFCLMPRGATAGIIVNVYLYEMVPFFAIGGEVTRVRTGHTLANEKLAAVVTTRTRRYRSAAHQHLQRLGNRGLS